jgi:N-acetylmuramoyl-L-alanine amidase
VIANVTSPAVLIEGGFITNKDELSKLASEDYRDQLAAAITDGIVRYRDVISQRESGSADTAQKSAE